MEQRCDFRINFDERVAITLLHKDDGSLAGRFIEWADNGMKIRLDGSLEAGTLLRLEIGEDLMVAEVCHCESDGEGYSASLSLLEWIEKSELKRLMREVVAGPSSERMTEVLAA